MAGAPRFQFRLSTILLGITFLAPWFFLYSYVHKRKPELANGLFLGVLGFAGFMVLLVIIGSYSAKRIRPMRNIPQRPMCGPAMVSYVCGFSAALMTFNFGMSPFLGRAFPLSMAIPPALAAIGCALAARRRFRQEPDLEGRFHAWFGFLAGVVVVVGLPLWLFF